MLKLIRDTLLPLPSMRHFLRYFTTKKTATPSEKLNVLREIVVPRIRKRKAQNETANYVTRQQLVIDYLKSVGSNLLIKEFCKEHLTISRTPKHVYLADPDVAIKFKKLIEQDLVQDSSIIVGEINPGIGLLTANLLQLPIPKIFLYEPKSTYLKETSLLKLLVKNYPDRLVIYKDSFLDMWQAAFLDFKRGGNRVDGFFKGIEKRKWSEEPCMKVIGVICIENYIRHILMGVIFRDTFLKYGRIIFYLLVSPPIWEEITAQKGMALYNKRSVLFQVMFNYYLIGSLPRKAFIPWTFEKHKSNSRKVKLPHLNIKSFYLVKIEPKVDLFNDNFSEDNLRQFYYFIIYHMRKRHTRIIPALEKWVPLCGPRLIAKDINIYTKFDELSPNELLKLYIQFSSWPEFETSSFLPCMTSFINRIQEAVSIFDMERKED